MLSGVSSARVWVPWVRGMLSEGKAKGWVENSPGIQMVAYRWWHTDGSIQMVAYRWWHTDGGIQQM